MARVRLTESVHGRTTWGELHGENSFLDMDDLAGNNHRVLHFQNRFPFGLVVKRAIMRPLVLIIALVFILCCVAMLVTKHLLTFASESVQRHT